MTIPLFDPPPKPTEAPRPRPHVGTDVILRVEHKAGPFRHLPGERTYQMVVLMDGRVFAEFTDTHERRFPPGVTRATIDEHLKSREWRNVTEGREG